jgi:predicted RNA binding protein YcfA (HicA-like mRNA interferase family)
MPKLPLVNADMMMKIIEMDGWRLDRTEGSHFQFVHSIKPGLVTVDKHGRKDLSRNTIMSILRQAGMTRQDYLEKRGKA